MIKVFKQPMLFPNKQETLKYIFTKTGREWYESNKLDGIRMVPDYDQSAMISRSLKPINNIQIKAKFNPIVEISHKYGIIMDGEAYAHGWKFDEIKSFVMSTDITTEKHLKSVRKRIKEGKLERPEESYTSIPDEMLFHCFGCYIIDRPNATFKERYEYLQEIYEKEDMSNFSVLVEQRLVKDEAEAKKRYDMVIEQGYEGLMFNAVDAPYKFGRITKNEAHGFKFKPFETTDALVVGVFERTSVKEGIAKTINELGRSVTSKKQDDREGNGMIGGFWVETEEHGKFKVPVKEGNEEMWKSMWENKESYIGIYIEFSYMKIGMGEKPRLPKYIRDREDKI